MMDPLAPLLADGVIDEVVARLKSGKEADVWLVRHGGEIIAAKVYKARHARSFKNNAAYKEGRQVRDTRTQRAMDRGSRFGQAAAEEAWKTKESDALHRLHAAGIRVPRPVMFYEGVLLMEVVVDASGHPAPRLVDAPVATEQAAALYADLRRQAIGMLACDVIHGDLSPYNVLLGSSGPVVIDFPQVVGAAHNSQAEAFFLRDLENLRRFFAALDPALGAAEGDGREIWRAYVRRELSPDFVPTGRSAEAHRPRSGDGRPHHQVDAARGGGHGNRPAESGPHRGGPRPDARDHRGGPAPARGGPRPGAAPQRPPEPQGAPRPQQGPQRPPQPQGAQRPQPSPQRPPQPQGSPRSQQGPQRPPQPQGGQRPQPSPQRPPQPQGSPRSQQGPQRPPQPQGAPRSQQGPQRPPQPHGSGHRSSQLGRPPGPGPRRGPDRPGRGTPMPEVIRVARPPLGSPPSHGAGPRRDPPPPHAAQPPQHGSPKSHPGASSHPTPAPRPGAPGQDAGGRRRRRRHRPE